MIYQFEIVKNPIALLIKTTIFSKPRLKKIPWPILENAALIFH